MGTKAVIIVPSQGKHASIFKDVAKSLKFKVYANEAVVVETTVRNVWGKLIVTFSTLDGKSFSWTEASNLDRVLTISHAGFCDGPNLASEEGGYQPWGSLACDATLSVEGAKFWAAIGKALKAGGKIILLGCSMGEGLYGQAVANVSKRSTYASNGLFAAGDEPVALKYVKAIEKGLVIPPMKRFDPEKT